MIKYWQRISDRLRLPKSRKAYDAVVKEREQLANANGQLIAREAEKIREVQKQVDEVLKKTCGITFHERDSCYVFQLNINPDVFRQTAMHKDRVIMAESYVRILAAEIINARFF